MSLDVTQLLSSDMTFTLLGALYLFLAIFAGFHVVLNKQNEASAFSWLGIIILAPLLGVLLYWLFGINRIRRRAQAELSDHSFDEDADQKGHVSGHSQFPESWQALMDVGFGIHAAPYLSGNKVVPLLNGDAVYPEMIQAISDARQSVMLSSYIFEYDEVGAQFVDALVSANDRGVSVRVLIDGIGVGYGFSLVRADRVLRSRGVKTARFLSTFSTTGTRFINLRNHRKILSVDGKIAFVGGINIRQENLLSANYEKNTKKTQDVHFKVQGPVINQINVVFASDWQFATKEKLNIPVCKEADVDEDAQEEGDFYRTSHSIHESVTGDRVAARVLVDGPDDNYQKLHLAMLGAIQAAEKRIQIVTPYFLPGALIMNALQLAVLRGVQVDLCVPEKNNLPPVGWAMKANMGRLLTYGIRIYESPEPFDHSKLFLIDDYWSMIGSSNWDARSLELNFEINLECYSLQLNRLISVIIAEKLASASIVDNGHDQHIFKQVRNNFCRLFSPYL